MTDFDSMTPWEIAQALTAPRYDDLVSGLDPHAKATVQAASPTPQDYLTWLSSDRDALEKRQAALTRKVIVSFSAAIGLSLVVGTISSSPTIAVITSVALIGASLAYSLNLWARAINATVNELGTVAYHLFSRQLVATAALSSQAAKSNELPDVDAVEGEDFDEDFEMDDGTIDDDLDLDDDAPRPRA